MLSFSKLALYFRVVHLLTRPCEYISDLDEKKSTEQRLLSYGNSSNKKGTSQPSPVHDHNQEKQEMQLIIFLLLFQNYYLIEKTLSEEEILQFSSKERT